MHDKYAHWAVRTGWKTGCRDHEHDIEPARVKSEGKVGGQLTDAGYTLATYSWCQVG